MTGRAAVRAAARRARLRDLLERLVIFLIPKRTDHGEPPASSRSPSEWPSS